jgi:hypothetical protein
MILKLSKSFADQIRAPELWKAEVESEIYQEWCVRVFLVRNKKYILTTESHSLFSVIIEAKRIKNIDSYCVSFLETLKGLTEDYNVSDKFDEVISSFKQGLFIFKADDKSLLATMNDLAYHAKWRILEKRADAIGAAKSINEMPALSRNAAYPIELFGKIKMVMNW